MNKQLKDIEKVWNRSVSWMDNLYVKVAIIVILILYSSTIFNNINIYVGSIYKNNFVKLVVLILIAWLAPKCPIVALLLAVSFVVSVIYSRSNEHFENGDDVQKNESDYQSPKKALANEVEQFVPGMFSNSDAMTQNDVQNMNVDKKINEMKDNINHNCKDLYNPKFEAVGDLCKSVQTFTNELNPQGLNHPQGFDGNVMGSNL